MPLFQVLRSFLEMHVLIAIGYLLFAAAWRLARPPRAGGWVRLGQAVVALAIALPLVTALIPKRLLWRPSAQIWVGGARGAQPYTLVAPAPARQDPAAVATTGGLRFPVPVLKAAVLCLLLANLLSLLQYAARRRRLGRYLRAQIVGKRCRRVTLLLSPDAVVPFSARWRSRAYVVLPAEMVGTAQARVSFRHEATHHRRGDTVWAHAMEAVSVLLVGNPAVGALARLLEQLQEFACDEAVVAKGMPATEYGRGLFAVAQWSAAAHAWPPHPRMIRALAALLPPTFLRRRIARLLESEPSAPPLMTALGVTLLAGGLLAAAFALRSGIQDRRLSLADLRALAAVPSAIPLDANELVLARLNSYVGTPEGRRIIQKGLRRMPAYRRMIEARLKEFGVPEELIALPLFESAFENEAVSGMRAAGIWQFMAQTARRYGLIVDRAGRRDERFVPERETVAAMRYLSDLYREFGDWRLAIKAYNEGEYKVERLIARTGTRDPWRLERISSSENYLSGAIATMIVLKNPQIVD